MTLSTVANFPPELLDNICAAIYHASVLPFHPTLDPIVIEADGTPTGLPSLFPPAHWPEAVARRALYNLCLTSHAWSEAAKPWLWRRVEVRLPQNWLPFVGELTGGEEEVNEDHIENSITKVTNAALACGSLDLPADEDAKKALHESILASLSEPNSSIPLELLSPPASREPSPRRLRNKSKSPARWKIMQSITDALQAVVRMDGSDYFAPATSTLNPGRHVRRIDFSHFRTIGMRRSDGEAIEHRFVTSERLENVLKECPNLSAFGAMEYMDGALSFSVLKELLLRGSACRGRGRMSRGRSLTIEIDDDDFERRKECKDLVAVDFTGCISAIFFSALNEFVKEYIDVSDSANASEDENGRGSPSNRKFALQFPGLQRLGLMGVRSVRSDVLESFILAFPNLTHLDLSCTRVSPELLASLGASETLRLEALALSRCTRLTGDSITDLLVNGRCTYGLKQLNLYGDATYGSPLTAEHLSTLLTQAPCFTSNALEYLDLSSSPLSALHLSFFPQQPKLRSLGLSYIRNLPVRAVADFLLTRAPSVEVLSLVSSTPELAVPVSGRVFSASMALHSLLIQPLSMPPIHYCAGLDPEEDAKMANQGARTRLRVIELATPLLNGLGAGAGTWRIIRSKGGRAWYVDVACGWTAELGVSSSPDTSGATLRRSLQPGHPVRKAMERLADARGNVNSGTGWHSRKMEILEGHGMLGREDGLYGAVAFAYQG